jgi:hypothetical protein
MKIKKKRKEINKNKKEITTEMSSLGPNKSGLGYSRPPDPFPSRRVRFSKKVKKIEKKIPSRRVRRALSLSAPLLGGRRRCPTPVAEAVRRSLRRRREAGIPTPSLPFHAVRNRAPKP